MYITAKKYFCLSLFTLVTIYTLKEFLSIALMSVSNE